jgi:N-acetylmuramoyl-L-alanine amidase
MLIKKHKLKFKKNVMAQYTIKLLLFVSLLITLALYPLWIKQPKELILILDPAGDAKQTGRAIGESFERGLTLQCAEKLKTLVEDRYPHVKIIITRLPGDIVYELQNASLANRLEADLFINLNFYLTTQAKPTLFIYQFSCKNDFASYQSGLALNTYDQAYKINKHTTDMLAKHMSQQLSQASYSSLFTVSSNHNVPIKPLMGVIAPSLALEIGLKNSSSWHLFIEPLATAIGGLIKQLMEQE